MRLAIFGVAAAAALALGGSSAQAQYITGGYYAPVYGYPAPVYAPSVVTAGFYSPGISIGIGTGYYGGYRPYYGGYYGGYRPYYGGYRGSYYGGYHGGYHGGYRR